MRVRYTDCDPMGIAHHSVYPVWLEVARAEWLRQAGSPYSDLEQRGVFFVMARMSLRYKRPARYDQVLSLCVQAAPIAGSAPVKIDHRYEVFNGRSLLATAATTLVCVDGAGKPRTIPDRVLCLLGSRAR